MAAQGCGSERADTAASATARQCSVPRALSGEFGLLRKGLGSALMNADSYFFTADCWLATHCHFPSDIFTHASVQRSRRSILVPSPSTPFPAHAPVAIAVSP